MDIFDPIVKNLGINWKIFLAQLINFGIVFFVLKKFAFSPIQKVLKERQTNIKKGLDDAEKATSELNMAKEKYKEEIKRARTEANKIIAGAQKQHDEIIQKADEKSQERSNQFVQKAEKEIQNKKKEMMADMKKETIELSILAAEQFLEGRFNTKQNQNFIEEMIKTKT